MGNHLFVGHTKVPVQEVEQLSLHQVDIGDGEKALSVVGPVNVLGRRVIMEFGSQNQAAQENSVTGARKTLCILRQLLLQSFQVHQGSHQGTGVNVCVSDQSVDEGHQRWQWLSLAGGLLVLVFQAWDHLQSLNHELVDHVLGHSGQGKDVQCFQVDGGHHCTEICKEVVECK